MVVFKIFVVLLGALAFTTDNSYGQSLSPRMLNGIPADTMRRFPHHVTIQPRYLGPNGKELPIYGGSIIHKQWVLTSLLAVNEGDILEIFFQKLYKNSTAGSYGTILNNDETAVHKFPTMFDDIAMIKLPFILIPSDTVKPIELSKWPAMQKQLAVLPGFESKENDASPQKGQLTYTMMRLASKEVCQNSYESKYDEFNNLCAVPYSKKLVPCLNERGSGLVIDWPADPKLIGIYSSTSKDCNPSYPNVFINIWKYYSWIIEHFSEESTTPAFDPYWETTTASPS